MPLVVAPTSHATQPPFTPASENISQENLATPVTAQTLLMLTSRPKFDKTATPAVSDHAQSLAQPSQHIEKLPFEAPSQAEVFPNMDDI